MNKKITALALLACSMAVGTQARTAQGLTIYINPGHGGHDSDDRNVVIAPYKQGDPNGYWESNSNLEKGLALRDMLVAKGYKVVMSRTTNTTADDLPLSTIVARGNASNANLYFSIHSNATGTGNRVNFPLMLFRGYDNEPQIPAAKDLCLVLNKHLLENQLTHWTQTSINTRGDWSFYHSWGTSGLGALRGLTVTGMLSEGSFHDYVPEAYRLMCPEYCWLEAWHFRKAIDEVLGVDPDATGVVCGRLNDSRMPREADYAMFGIDKLATVQNALVTLKDQQGNTVQTYTTHDVHVNGLYLFKDVAPGTYTVSVTSETHQPKEETVTVTANQCTYCNLALDAVRTSAPKVVSYEPLWHDGDEPVLCNTPIKVNFNWDMDLESAEKAFSISPEVKGTFSWEDVNHRMVFTPEEPYDISTLYTVTINKSAMHGGLTPMDEDFSFSFFTTNRNFMTVLSSFPQDGGIVHYTNAQIEFRFDKYPNCSKLQSQVTAVNSKGEKVAFNSRGVTNSKVGSPYGFFRIPFSKALTVGETYYVTVSGEMADKDGLTIPAPITVKFTATDEGQPKNEHSLIYDLNDPALFAHLPESSSMVTSASVAAHKQPLFDQAVGFTYAFSDTEGGEVTYTITEPQAEPQAASESTASRTLKPGQNLGVHVQGDLSGNQLYFEITTPVSIQYIPVATLDYLGWRYVSVPMPLEDEGTLTGIKLVQTPSQASVAGTFGLDDILVEAAAGVQLPECDELTIAPNPADQYIVASAPVTITAIELFDMAGTQIARNNGNVINVSALPQGTYICVAYTQTTRTTRRVIVKH